MIEAQRIIQGEGLTCRLVSEDGIQYAGTADRRPDRVNIETIDGVVTGAEVG